MPGKYFDELEVGMKFKHALGRTITEMDNVLFSAHQRGLRLQNGVRSAARQWLVHARTRRRLDGGRTHRRDDHCQSRIRQGRASKSRFSRGHDLCRE